MDYATSCESRQDGELGHSGSDSGHIVGSPKNPAGGEATMGLTRYELAAEVRERYYAATGRKERSQMLDQFCGMTGYHRKHDITVMRGRQLKPARRGRRGRVYDGSGGGAPEGALGSLGLHAKPSAKRVATRPPSPEPMVTERRTPIKDVVAAIAERMRVPSS